MFNSPLCSAITKLMLIHFLKEYFYPKKSFLKKLQKFKKFIKISSKEIFNYAQIMCANFHIVKTHTKNLTTSTIACQLRQVIHDCAIARYKTN